PDIGRAADSMSVLGIPLTVAGEVIGALRVGSRGRREFSPDDVQFLQIIADRMALSIEHARLIESETQARREADIAAETLRARDHFLTVVAHELKTPMTALQLAGELLMRNQAPDADPEQTKPYRVIDLQIRRLNRIVDQVLDATRSNAGTLTLHRRSANLTRLLNRTVRSAQLRARRHEIELTAPADLRAFVDVAKLEQVFSHLVDNAIKFSPEGGRIDIVLAETGSGVCVSIRDRGLGVPPEHRPHLFERFHRAHAGDYRSGIGLGLYLCKEIVNLHGGSIRAEFPDDGGTRFVIEIPGSQEANTHLRTTNRQEVS
ncbi:MAG TPA: ATP-binding protein, partial [Chloroflexota bacterium]|nr:ATP-binding protein [Chloroflexota bacterium]